MLLYYAVLYSLPVICYTFCLPVLILKVSMQSRQQNKKLYKAQKQSNPEYYPAGTN
jgi:hypothetical protein